MFIYFPATPSSPLFFFSSLCVFFLPQNGVEHFQGVIFLSTDGQTAREQARNRPNTFRDFMYSEGGWYLLRNLSNVRGKWESGYCVFLISVA